LIVTNLFIIIIDLIIFSKDRAFQLDGLLSSLKENCNIFSCISILYKTSNDYHEKAYKQLSKTRPIPQWWQETDFKRDLLSMMSRREFTCFMVDDMICFKKVPQFEIEDELCYSLRLGSNIRNYPGKNRWNWKEADGYFKYPFSVDGHIFRTNYIKTLLEAQHYTNPNKLETKLQKYKHEAEPMMSCLPESCVVSIPINKTSETSRCSAGDKHPASLKWLNEMYLDGHRMDWQAMNINPCLPHEEIEIKWHT